MTTICGASGTASDVDRLRRINACIIIIIIIIMLSVVYDNKKVSHRKQIARQHS